MNTCTICNKNMRRRLPGARREWNLEIVGYHGEDLCNVCIERVGQIARMTERIASEVLDILTRERPKFVRLFPDYHTRVTLLTMFSDLPPQLLKNTISPLFFAIEEATNIYYYANYPDKFDKKFEDIWRQRLCDIIKSLKK